MKIKLVMIILSIILSTLVVCIWISFNQCYTVIFQDNNYQLEKQNNCSNLSFPNRMKFAIGNPVYSSIDKDIRFPIWSALMGLPVDPALLQAGVENDRKCVSCDIITSQNIDLDDNGIEEFIELKNKQITIKSNNAVIWESDKDWKIDQFIVSDINNDGIKNLILSIWKKGSFGDHLPFWIDKNDERIENHLFVYKMKKGKIQPVWHSSRLPNPIRNFKIYDIDKDGKNELIVLEGEYNWPRWFPARYINILKFKQFNFFSEWKSEKGIYQNIISK